MVDISTIRVGDRVRVVSDLDSVRPDGVAFEKKEYQGVEFLVKRIHPYYGVGRFKTSQPYRVTLEGEDNYYWYAEELESVYQYVDVPIDDSDIAALLEAM